MQPASVVFSPSLDPASRWPRMLPAYKAFLSAWSLSFVLLEWHLLFPQFLYFRFLLARASGLTAPFWYLCTAQTCCPCRGHMCIWSMASSLWHSLLLSSILGPKGLNDEGYLVSCPINLYCIRGESCVNLWVLIFSVKILALVERGALKAVPPGEGLLAVDGCWGGRATLLWECGREEVAYTRMGECSPYPDGWTHTHAHMGKGFLDWGCY